MPRVGRRYLEGPSHSYQIGKRIGFHLLHDPSAMDLNRYFAYAKLGRHLFVEKAADE